MTEAGTRKGNLGQGWRWFGEAHEDRHGGGARDELLLGEAADLLLRYHIYGAPVVDEADQLVGMVSFMDLAARRGKTVRDVMAPDPVCAAEDTPVEQIAATMLDQMVRRIPIVRGGWVVGVVSGSDIIQVFLNLHEIPASEGEPAVARAKVRRR